MREWIDIQADLFAQAEAQDPGAWLREVNFQAGKERVRLLREAESAES